MFYLVQRNFPFVVLGLLLVGLAFWGLGYGSIGLAVEYVGFAILGLLLAVYDRRPDARIIGAAAALVFAFLATLEWPR